ncbi:MAG TPA: exodeoxyribonuclease VII large subunit [Burkholderiales bacterium]|nr:exodeoxyribonuclease VII large subunit [Burkholderiales bacterium]
MAMSASGAAEPARSPLELALQPSGVPLSVTQLNAIARQLLERNLPLLWVAGEISNCTRAPSGHLYFSLKDERAQVRCVLFRGRAQYLDWNPGNGMQVEVRAAPSLYEPRGEFQLTVDFMRRAGLGVLFEKFARLKAKLEQEGLFASGRKRPLPRHPARIGLVTSPRAAALRDVLSTLRRRLPRLPVVIYPAPVQGEGAGAQVAAAIRTAGERRECDVLILCRGGGSIEDLWAFNEEPVARAMAACPIPIVTGVGHETDFTIADFVADVRAPTPTAAAELASPDRAELAARLRAVEGRAQRCLLRALEQRTQQVDFLARRLVHPGRWIEERRRHLAHLCNRLGSALARGVAGRALPVSRLAHRLAAAAPDFDRLRREQGHLRARLVRAQQVRMDRRAEHLARLRSHLAHLDPRQVLQRGYSIVTTEQGGIVRSSAELRAGDAVRLEFGQGEAGARITRTD